MERFYETIDREFGTTVRNQLKDFADCNRKRCNMEARKEFLLNCRRNGVFPAHIQNSFKCVYDLMEERSPYLKKLGKCIAKFKKTILNLEIQQTFYKIKVLHSTYESMKVTIQHQIPKSVWESFYDSQRRYYERSLKESRKNTNKKYQQILERTAKPEQLPTVNIKALPMLQK